MSPTPSRARRPAPGSPGASLGHVLTYLGTTLLDVAAAQAGSPPVDALISAVVIHDPLDPPELPERVLVLAVGVRETDPLVALVERTAAAGGVGVVVRAPAPAGARVAEAVARTGTVLLELVRGASWNQLAALLRGLLGEGQLGFDEHVSLGGVPAGDLFALANAVAALLDAPVTIEDRSSRILAFSGRQDEADPSRVESVLGRQVPDRLVRQLEANGVFQRLYTSERPIVITPEALGMPGVSLARAAVAVRAGDELLGTVWAAVAGPLSAEQEQGMVDTAKLVALHLLRMRAGSDVERRLLSELVAVALEGGPGALDALRRLGLADRALLVLVMGLPEEAVREGTLSLARRETERQRSADALAVHLSALRHGSVVAVVGERVYGLLPVAAGEDEEVALGRAASIASTFLDRTAGRIPAVLGIGTLADGVSALARSRSGADRALRVLRSGSTARRVARITDVQLEALMLQLSDLAASEGYSSAGPVARLEAYDAAHRSELVDTLRSWLDAFGDVIVAAERLHIHPNTMRYRLRRISEVGQVDLGDPDARFAAMLGLRLMHPDGARARQPAVAHARRAAVSPPGP